MLRQLLKAETWKRRNSAQTDTRWLGNQLGRNGKRGEFGKGGAVQSRDGVRGQGEERGWCSGDMTMDDLACMSWSTECPLARQSQAAWSTLPSKAPEGDVCGMIPSCHQRCQGDWLTDWPLVTFPEQHKASGKFHNCVSSKINLQLCYGGAMISLNFSAVQLNYNLKRTSILSYVLLEYSFKHKSFVPLR